MPYEMLVPSSWKKNPRNGIYYDERVDIWCLGVLLYAMLYDSTPFMTRPFDKEATRKLIKELKLNFPKQSYSDADDLIRKILVPPVSRLSLAEILQHKWLR